MFEEILTLAAAVSPGFDLGGLSGRGGQLLAYVVASLVKVAEADIGRHVGVRPTRLCLLPWRSDGAVVVGPARRQSGLSVHGTYRSHCGDGEAAALLEALVGAWLLTEGTLLTCVWGIARVVPFRVGWLNMTCPSAVRTIGQVGIESRLVIVRSRIVALMNCSSRARLVRLLP